MNLTRRELEDLLRCLRVVLYFRVMTSPNAAECDEERERYFALHDRLHSKLSECNPNP